MAKPILMPQVGQDIETGKIVEWLVQVGDSVKKGDIIATVESEKAAFDLESYETGYILKLLYEPGDEAKVLEPIAYIGAKDEIVTSTEEITETAKKEVIPKADMTRVKLKILASPLAKRIARENDIDLNEITGTGPNGRIVKRDIEAYLAAVKIKEPALQVNDTKISQTEVSLDAERGDSEIPFSRMRQKIAERLQKSKQTIPHFYLFIDVDMTAALAWRIAINQRVDSKISINDLLIKVTASAITKFPGINGHVMDDKFIQRKDINIGMAVSVEEGLLVPVIPNGNKKSIEEISVLARKNSENARKGILSATSIATFTISNLGMHAINAVLPIINPPECAILGVGKTEKRIVPLENSTFAVRDYMTLTLACDHRVVDGIYAARFLNQIKDNLENLNL